MFEVIVGVISLASLALNFLIYQKVKEFVTGSQELSVELIEREAQVGEVLPSIEESVVKDPEPAVTTPMVQEVYSAWKNQTNIPWTEPIKPPAPPVKTDVPGPLERPHGFV